MVRNILLALLALLVVSAVRGAVPHPWKSTGDVPSPEAPLRLTISLQQENLDELERLFWERSNPQHPRYAQYLTRQELADLIAPGAVHERVVRAWLVAAGVPTEQIVGVETRDVLYVNTTIAVAEELLHVRYEVFEHHHALRKLWRSADAYTLPPFMHKHIQMVHGVTDFPPLRRRTVSHAKPQCSKKHHLMEKLEAVAVPTVVITEVNGRSQLPGTVVEVYAKYSCPSGETNCVDTMTATASSSNVNIEFTASTQLSASSCQNSECHFVIPVEFYVPLQITVVATSSSGDVAKTSWDYPVVVDPHVVPQALWELYNMGTNPLVTNMSATQSVVEFEEQYYSVKDLQEFFILMGLPRDATVVEIGPNPSPAGGEANLDIQWIMAMAPGAPTYFWSVRAKSDAEIDHILTWCYEIGNYTNPPLVNSLSYGMTEGNVDKYLGDGYLNRTNTELQKLALQGLTIIIADGDVGANDIGPPPMSQLKCYPSHPDWPSDSSYITAIGSTFITPLSDRLCYAPGGSNCLNNPLGEVTTSVDMGMSWTTGGGFSNITPRPAYQNDAVNTYLKNASGTVPDETYFNAQGRAYADAVTVGHNLEVVLDSEIVAIDGTSASAPIFAGMVTVLNNARLNAGKTPLGFITPMMYQSFAEAPACWRDVTVGHNKCGAYGWSPVCCPTGFTATVGWDPVSGVGSPNLGELMNYVLSLP